MEIQPDPASANTSKFIFSSTAELPASSRNSCYSFQEHSLLLHTAEHYPSSNTVIQFFLSVQQPDLPLLVMVLPNLVS